MIKPDISLFSYIVLQRKTVLFTVFIVYHQEEKELKVEVLILQVVVGNQDFCSKNKVMKMTKDLGFIYLFVCLFPEAQNGEVLLTVV